MVILDSGDLVPIIVIELDLDRDIGAGHQHDRIAFGDRVPVHDQRRGGRAYGSPPAAPRCRCTPRSRAVRLRSAGEKRSVFTRMCLWPHVEESG